MCDGSGVVGSCFLSLTLSLSLSLCVCVCVALRHSPLPLSSLVSVEQIEWRGEKREERRGGVERRVERERQKWEEGTEGSIGLCLCCSITLMQNHEEPSAYAGPLLYCTLLQNQEEPLTNHMINPVLNCFTSHL